MAKGSDRVRASIEITRDGFILWDERPRQDWAPRAACRGSDPAKFFVTVGVNADEAKAVCARCVVREPCLDYALQTHEGFGIWGGLSPEERNQIRRRALKALKDAG